MVGIPKLTLTYFNFAGRAEPIRLAAAIGKVPFTNKAVTMSEWSTLKKAMPLGQMPLLEIEETDGDVRAIVQSNAILRYIGKLGGLYPSDDPIKAILVDSYIDTFSEASALIEMTVMGPVKKLIADEPWTKDQLLQNRQRLVENSENGLPFYFSYFDKVLEENGTGWLVGDTITIADLTLYRLTNWVSSGVLDGIPKSFIEPYAHVTKLVAQINDLSQVVEWRSKYSIPYDTFTFDNTPK